MINNQGIEMTIIKRIPGQTKNLLVEFNDEFKTQVYCSSNLFGKGSVNDPNFKKDVKLYKNEKKRIGSEGVNYLDEKMKVIAYRSSTDIDVEFQDQYKAIVNTTWKSFIKGQVKNPSQLLTGNIKHPGNFVDISGKIFNDLLVIEWDTLPPETEYIKKENTGLWKCLCLKCGSYAWVNTYDLKSGSRKMCRKCAHEIKMQKRYNIKYDLTGEYGIGYTYNTNIQFYFDLEDYDVIKDFSWRENQKGYISARVNNSEVLMHRLVMGVTDRSQVIDHIRHNKFDNRKCMLRVTTCENNNKNEILAKNNKSGKTGVCFEEETGKWHSYIWYGKCIHLGRFDNIEDAIDARINAENKYYREFSYENSMRIGDINERNI